VVRFFVGQPESGFEVEMARGGKRVVGPQHHLFVASGASEVDALLYEPPAKAATAARIGDQQDPQLCSRVVFADTRHTSHSPAVDFGDPRLLTGRVMCGGKVGNDLSDECLQVGVPAKLAGVLLAVRHDHPAQITGLSEGPHHDFWLVPSFSHADSVSPLTRLFQCQTSGVQDGNQPNKQTPSPRRDQLLEASYQWVLQHGLADMSLRPLAEAVGSSPRVLLFLFGSKDDLIRALLVRARRDELILLDRLRAGSDTPDLAGAAAQVWQWLAAPEHRDLLRLWCEGYACSLINRGGPWAGFASQTVTDWLDLLAQFQPAESRSTEEAAAQRTYVLAVLRGAMLDLLATGDISRTSASITHLASRLRASA
jgi:AcrR family transcriptional regulator